LEGRYNVAYDDIARIAPPVLRHRLILNFDAVSDGLTEDTVVAKILEDVKK
jgi:MoxR-like ATPase